MNAMSKAEPPVNPRRKEPYQQRYRWVILAFLCLAYFVFSLVSRAIAPLVTPIIDDLNISYSQMGLILGSWQLTYVAVAVIAGTIIDKLGVRKSLFAGIVIIGLSGILRYFPGGFVTMLLVVALFGIGGPMLSIGSPKTISMWFRGKERGTAIGIYDVGMRLGGLMALAATNSVVMPLAGYSWRLTFVYYGLLAVVIAFMWLLLARDTRPAEDTGRTGIREVFAGLIQVRNVQILLVIGFFIFVVNHGLNNWLPKFLEAGGMSPAQAGFAASIPIVAGIPAVLVIPRLIPPRLRGRVLALFALMIAVILLMLVTTSGVPLYIVLVLFGIATAVFVPLILLILMETPEVSSRYMGSAGGMFFCIAELGGFAGPLILGAFVDVTGGFLAGVSLLAVLCLVVGAMAFFLKTQPAQ